MLGGWGDVTVQLEGTSDEEVEMVVGGRESGG